MSRWLRYGSMLVVLTGTVFTSCTVDLRDAALSGVMDAVTTTVADSLTSGVPLADWVANLWGQ